MQGRPEPSRSAFEWEARENVPGYPSLRPVYGPGDPLPLIRDRPCDDLAREHNALREGALEAADASVARFTEADEAEAAREQRVRAHAVDPSNDAPRGAAKAPGLRQEAADLAVMAQERCDRTHDLKRAWLAKLAERMPQIEAKRAKARERAAERKREAVEQIRGIYAEEATEREHDSFLVHAAGGIPRSSGLTVGGEGLSRGLPAGETLRYSKPTLRRRRPQIAPAIRDALALLERDANPPPEPQPVEFTRPTSLDRKAGRHDVAPPLAL